jgi:hypothetical protein
MSRGEAAPQSGAFVGTKLINSCRPFQIPPCALAHTSAINNSPRAVVWLAGRNCLQLSSLVRHLMFEEGVKAFNCPGHGTSFGKASPFPKGTFKARTSKRIFSQFSVFRLGMRRKWRHGSERKAILLRVFRAVSALLSPLPKTVHLWKTSGNPVGCID